MTEVTAQNEKVFNEFRERLSALDRFVPTSKKFGKWLGVDKAYYLEARPRIIDIILTAANTLRTQGPAAGDRYPTLVNAFIDLVHVIEPFQHRFVEPNLQGAVHHLLEYAASLEAPVPAPSPAAAAPQLSFPPPTVPVRATTIPSTGIQPSQQMRPSSSSLAAALTPTTPTTPVIPSLVSAKEESSKAVPDPSVPVSNTQSPPVVANSTPPVTSGSASVPAPPVASSSKLKRKKKKKKDDDIFSLIQPPDGTQIGKSVSSPAAPVSSGAPVESLIEVAQTAATTPIAVTAAPSILTSLPKGRPSSRPPTTVEDTPTADESKSKEPAPSEGIQSTDVDVIMNAQGQPEDVDMTAASSSAPNAASDALSAAENGKVARVLHMLTGSASSVGMAEPISSPEVAIAESADLSALKSDEAMPPVPDNVKQRFNSEGHPPQPTPEAATSAHNTSLEESIDMDVDTSQEAPTKTAVSPAAEPDELVAEPPVVTSAALQSIIQDIVNNANRHIASDTPSSMEVLPTEEISLEHGEFSTADLPVPNLTDHFEDITPSSNTGLGAATVVAHHRGLVSGKITINFHVKRDQMNAIMKWNNRSKHSDDLSDSLCLSLLCFAITDVKARLESSQSNDLRTLLPELECSWPKNGGLSMNALWNGKRVDFPMSPPFALPPNGLVDVSPFLVPARNTLCIEHTRDMTQYWLLLCAHHPTPSQLNAVARRRHKDRNWTGWLEKLTQPLQLPFSIPIEV
ncbi:hypothetical protein MVEN_02089900 [Mycena venus]|uniref:Uncharacterized protein n=1 Tax=Mycena venus TaxID=2733690 RepID=A0A8H7CJL4_9AGAR|nr:hypothetical protein MVEN_02089900 [Mycena venus]